MKILVDKMPNEISECNWAIQLIYSITKRRFGFALG